MTFAAFSVTTLITGPAACLRERKIAGGANHFFGWQVPTD